MEIMWYEQIKSSPSVQSSNPVHNPVQLIDTTITIGENTKGCSHKLGKCVAGFS